MKVLKRITEEGIGFYDNLVVETFYDLPKITEETITNINQYRFVDEIRKLPGQGGCACLILDFLISNSPKRLGQKRLLKYIPEVKNHFYIHPRLIKGQFLSEHMWISDKTWENLIDRFKSETSEMVKILQQDYREVTPEYCIHVAYRLLVSEKL